MRHDTVPVKAWGFPPPRQLESRKPGPRHWGLPGVSWSARWNRSPRKLGPSLVRGAGPTCGHGGCRHGRCRAAALALVQPLHGLTFAALHLACIRVISRIVASGLPATAQAMYALGAGAATALLTLASGALYARLGGRPFLMTMALLCAAVMPVALGTRGGSSRGRWRDDRSDN